MRKNLRHHTLLQCLIISSIALIFNACIQAADFKSIKGKFSSIDTTPGIRYLIEDTLEIPTGTHINLPPGTVFLFADEKPLNIRGSLTANGTDSAPVVFSSVNDSVYNKNAEGQATLFSWAGIWVGGGSESVILRNTIIRFADRPFVSQSASIRLENVKFTNTNLDTIFINDQVFSPIRNHVFYFPPPQPPPPKKTDTGQSMPPPDDHQVTNDKPWWKTLKVRLAVGGTGGLALCSGAGFLIHSAIKNNEAEKKWEESELARQHHSEQWGPLGRASNEAREASKKSFQTGVITSIIGVVFMSGFGLTFVF
jgi:hypothetical protein